MEDLLEIMEKLCVLSEEPLRLTEAMSSREMLELEELQSNCRLSKSEELLFDGAGFLLLVLGALFFFPEALIAALRRVAAVLLVCWDISSSNSVGVSQAGSPPIKSNSPITPLVRV